MSYKSPFMPYLWQPFIHGHTSVTSTFLEFSHYSSVKHLCALWYLHTAFVLFEVFCLHMQWQFRYSRFFCHFKYHSSDAFPDLHEMGSLSSINISKPGRLLYFSSQQLKPLSINGWYLVDMCLINMKQKFHNSTRARALSDSFTAEALEWKTEHDMPLMRDGGNIK